jgi:hypothetical protein
MNSQLPDAPVKLRDSVQRSAAWLMKQQDPTAGGWGEQPGKPPNVLNTAEAMISLLTVDAVEPGAQGIRKAVDFLLRHQSTDPKMPGAWFREVQGDDGHVIKAPDVLRTALSIQALIKAGKGVEEKAVGDGVDWLLECVHEDAGWSFSSPTTTEILPTCAALSALMDACSAGAEYCDEAINDGLRLVADKLANADGSFGRDELRAVHTMHVVLTMQKARKYQRDIRAGLEDAALNWLLANPDQAIKEVEERIVLSPAIERLNYQFLHLADSMLLTVLSGSEHQSHWTSGLYLEVLRKVGDRRAPEGGFFGHRVFSWSTARSTSALWLARDRREEIPERTPQYTGAKVGKVILSLALVLVAVLVVLSFSDAFGIVQALFLGFLLLACMVAYGAIGEKTFREIIIDIGKSLGRGKSA